MLKAAWVVPGFSSNEDDWCIPALLDLARAVAQRCDLTIVAMRYPYRRDTYAIGNATVHSIGGGHRGPTATPGIWRDTARVIRDLRGDVLHAFWAYEPGFIASWFSSRLPVVISLAGGELVDLPEIQYGLNGKLRTRIPIRWALRRARILTAGSTFMIHCMQQMPSLPRPHLLPLGIDLRRWPFTLHGTNPARILNVGSLEPVKGQAILLRAFAYVRQQVSSARLCIVGGGQESAALEKLILEQGLAGSVELSGAVPHTQLPAFYANASLFVQASRHESQGMALLEAASCGLPVVGTLTGALADLAPDAAVGVPVGDDRELASAILTMMQRPDHAARMARKARKKVEESYAIESVADRFVELYRSTL